MGIQIFEQILKIVNIKLCFRLKVFLLGPSHHIYLEGCGLTTMQFWDTPFGKI
jgi:AmmeMemoRadiSam system protein B